MQVKDEIANECCWDPEWNHIFPLHSIPHSNVVSEEVELSDEENITHTITGMRADLFVCPSVE